MADDVLAEILDALVEVPAGVTWIGSTMETVRTELAQPDMHVVQPEWLLKEVPRRAVSLAAFRISRVPLTTGQVAALADRTGLRPVPTPSPDHPATVGVDGSFALCRMLSDLLGRTVSLPTEEQWMRAARGDDERIYPWGDVWQEGLANMNETGRKNGICPVGQFPGSRSAFGLLDMAGNADELTSTRYAPFPGAPAEVPLTEDWAHCPYVTKGGGHLHARDLARCDRRHGVYTEGEALAVRLVVD